mgnify:CR=1 FL=1
MATSTIKILHDPGNTKQYVITVGQSMQFPIAVEIYDSEGAASNLTDYTVSAYFYVIGTTTQVTPSAGLTTWTSPLTGKFTFSNSSTLLNASGSAQYNLRFLLTKGAVSYEVGGDHIIWKVR